MLVTIASFELGSLLQLRRRIRVFEILGGGVLFPVVPKGDYTVSLSATGKTIHVSARVEFVARTQAIGDFANGR